MNQLALAFEQCSPLDPSSTTVDERYDLLVNGIEKPFAIFGDKPFDQAQWDSYLDSSNEFFNLPPSVLFPAAASDVVAAVRFAQDNNLEISLKTSGNNYSGMLCRQTLIPSLGYALCI